MVAAESTNTVATSTSDEESTVATPNPSTAEVGMDNVANVTARPITKSTKTDTSVAKESNMETTGAPSAESVQLGAVATAASTKSDVATISGPKFKKDERVIYTKTGQYGTVTRIPDRKKPVKRESYYVVLDGETKANLLYLLEKPSR